LFFRDDGAAVSEVFGSAIAEEIMAREISAKLKA
jgi:hypothetical protein